MFTSAAAFSGIHRMLPALDVVSFKQAIADAHVVIATGSGACSLRAARRPRGLNKPSTVEQ